MAVIALIIFIGEGYLFNAGIDLDTIGVSWKSNLGGLFLLIIYKKNREDNLRLYIIRGSLLAITTLAGFINQLDVSKKIVLDGNWKTSMLID